MTISTAVSLLSALIGSVATLLAAWGYLRTHRPHKGELLRIGGTITVIMVGIFGIALLISNFTSIEINGQKTVPVPPAFEHSFSTPAASPTPATVRNGKPTQVPSSTSGTSSSPTPVPASTPLPTQSTSSGQGTSS